MTGLEPTAAGHEPAAGPVRVCPVCGESDGNRWWTPDCGRAADRAEAQAATITRASRDRATSQLRERDELEGELRVIFEAERTGRA